MCSLRQDVPRSSIVPSKCISLKVQIAFLLCAIDLNNMNMLFTTVNDGLSSHAKYTINIYNRVRYLTGTHINRIHHILLRILLAIAKTCVRTICCFCTVEKTNAAVTTIRTRPGDCTYDF